MQLWLDVQAIDHKSKFNFCSSKTEYYSPIYINLNNKSTLGFCFELTVSKVHNLHKALNVGRKIKLMQLAKRIKEIRKAYGYSQAEIAYKCDISPQAYGQIERRAGKSSFETLTKIAESIGVSITFLVDVNNSEYTENKL